MNINAFLQPSNQATGIFQLTLPIAIYFGIQSDAGVLWWLMSVFFWGVVYIIIGNNIGLHRFFSHNHFALSKPVEYLLLWIGCMIGLGGPLSYSITHLVHHKYSDTERDPHGPIRGKQSMWIWLQKTVDIKETPIFSKQIFKLSTKYMWTHKFYIPLVLGSAAILYLIDIKVFFCKFYWIYYCYFRYNIKTMKS
jgi:stearoyl-CoA desaturase (delta-9 desaturase)